MLENEYVKSFRFYSKNIILNNNFIQFIQEWTFMQNHRNKRAKNALGM